MGRKLEKLKEFWSSRWVAMVGSMWVQSCAGVGYLFGSISPVIKSTMGYNQSLCEILPIWAIMLIGAVQVFFAVADTDALKRYFYLCVAIFIGTNGETYYDTAALVSCSKLSEEPWPRGWNFKGLSGAILTRVYAIFNASDQSSLIFMFAVGPSMVVIFLMFIVRPVGGHKQSRPSDNSSFMFIDCICLVLAAYMMGVVLVEDLLDASQAVIAVFVVLLIILIILPIIIPISLLFLANKTIRGARESDPSCDKPEPASYSRSMQNEVIFSELEDERPSDTDLLPELERQRRISQLHGKLFQAAADGAVAVKGRRRPHRVVIGLGHGELWAKVSAAASELFGLKCFGAQYNFLTMASPAGSLIFSSVIARGIYNYEAEKQSGLRQTKFGALTSNDSSCSDYVCYSITCGILSGLCIVAVVFSSFDVYRTRIVYGHLYGKTRS